MADQQHPKSSWMLFQGKGDKKTRPVHRWPEPPPWRSFQKDAKKDDRGETFIAPPGLADMVNAALYLRRPLLLTGKPGTGKSSVAYAIAYELELGTVLRWPITSRSTLLEGLYRYDSIGRLQEANLGKARKSNEPPDIGDYLILGPLGTAFYDSKEKPRVLLIDEIDKSDIDLPNDLLNIFEEGEFEIPELVRYSKQEVSVRLFGSKSKDDKQKIIDGKVPCGHFPVVILTSNGEREFPPALLRRCLRLDLAPPDQAELSRIVEAHLGPELSAKAAGLIDRFFKRRQGEGHLSNDQLLNAVFLLMRELEITPASREDLEKKILQTLGEGDRG